jgi:hypothetical protein
MITVERSDTRNVVGLTMTPTPVDMALMVNWFMEMDILA